MEYYMEGYTHLSQYESKEDFDTNRKLVFYRLKDKLSKGALAVWNELAQRAVQYPGVCYVRIEVLCKSTNVSRSTVERAIRLLKKLGAIKVVETIRPKKGGDGANVYVFQKLGEGALLTGRQDRENLTESKEKQPKSEKDTNIFKDLYNTNHLNNRRSAYIKYVPKVFQHYKQLFGSSLKDLYSRVWLAAKNLNVNTDRDTMHRIAFIALEAIKQYKNQYKQNGTILTEELQKKLAYKVSYNQIKQGLEDGSIFNDNDWYDFLDRIKERKKQDGNNDYINEDTTEELNNLHVY
ncbi:helix-turn-helix domain-containing protein (plasmid) [Niallia taxi]|uniref:helix-turn-helix domain-containing protein n=1 Tax=Niallia taxi TaxID=2499688 RepID=UPI003F618A37